MNTHLVARRRRRLVPLDDGPPIRREPFCPDDPFTEEDDHAEDGSPIFERLAVLQMSGPSYFTMMQYLTTNPYERAVALIGPKDHDVVTHVLIDESGDASSSSFTLGHVLLNDRLKTYVAAGLDAKGIAHSHPPGCNWPSLGDLTYVAKCFATDRQGMLTQFLLPIVVGNRLFPYVVLRGDPRIPVVAQVILF